MESTTDIKHRKDDLRIHTGHGRSHSGDDAYPDIPNVGSPGRASGFEDNSSTDSFEDDDDIIPSSHDHRTLVLCFDGTGDQFDDDNSNVVNFFSLLKKDDSRKQLVYYQSGIGTYTIPQIAKPMMARLKKTLDSMIGVHLNAHVMTGYEFLMQNYQAGDKICIFGFSRGAYTARALAGMIHKVGLLPKCNHQQVPFAYKMYKREDEKGWKQSTMFKKAFAIDVDIEFLGVWDTVGSVGVVPRRLPFTTSNSHIKYFRHAIALDERRARFHPNFFHRPTLAQSALGVQRGEMPKSRPPVRRGKSGKSSLKQLERQYTDGNLDTNVEEVWFCGCHCDVGGGAVKNETRHALARIPLRWMIRQCFLLDTGILFHRSKFRQVGLDPNTLYPVVKTRPPPLANLPNTSPGDAQQALNEAGANAQNEKMSSPQTMRTLVDEIMPSGDDFISEEVEDLKDVLSPINDMLRLAKMWWILELLPSKQHWKKHDDSLARRLSINFGRGRVMPKQQHNGKHVVKLHRTVKLRMDAEGLGYVPRARWDVEPLWVD
ncbi:hypothetical protein HGRIS_008735 [Hohenbuehelia grisea]|uniref:T6SS Phospholipase effector Tle1-like catalytic domain-containing protein n=1 Tax=Hohenbuehelia grisea TaxID=104357 RepID=A0ABR3J935_9AGAR